MNVVDAVSAAYVAFGAVRGHQRGLAEEMYRLLRIGIAFAAGCGLYGIVSSLIGKVLSLGGDISAPVGFVTTMGVAWSALRYIKRGLSTWISSRFSRYEKLGGAIVGGIRTFVVILTIATTLHLTGRGPGNDTVSNGSFVGRLVERVLPGH